jgi:hypothetical protein
MAITKVWERLYVGDAHNAGHLSFSNPLGITVVVNVNEAPNPEPLKAGRNQVCSFSFG